MTRLPIAKPRRTVATVLLGLTGALAAGLVGLDAVHMALVACAIVAIGVVTGDPGTEQRLAALPAPERRGARPEVTDLSWLLGDGSVAPGFHRRLRRAARDRLATYGVRLEDTAALIALLGAGPASVLTSAERPSERAVLECLDALEHLEPAKRLHPAKRFHSAKRLHPERRGPAEHLHPERRDPAEHLHPERRDPAEHPHPNPRSSR